MKFLLKVSILLIQNSKLFSYPPLRGVRWALYRKYLGVGVLYVDVGVNISTAHQNKRAYFRCGDYVHLSNDVYIDYSGGVEIGNHVSISEHAKIYTHNHDIHGDYKNWKKNKIEFSDLVLEDYSWVGSNAIILSSVNIIAEGSVVAAGSILTKDTEPYSIYGGNPAKKIGERRNYKK